MGVIMKVSQKYFTRQQVALGDVNGHVEEMYTGHTVVKAYCGEERSIEQFEKYNKDLYVSGWKSQFLSGLMMPIMNFVGNFGYVVVCVVGAALAMDGKIEFGRDRGVHDVHPPVHAAAVPVRAGLPEPAALRGRIRTRLRLP